MVSMFTNITPVTYLAVLQRIAKIEEIISSLKNIFSILECSEILSIIRKLTLDPVKPMNCRSLVILGGNSDITRLKVPTPSWTPPSKCDLNLSFFSDQFLHSRISQHVLEMRAKCNKVQFILRLGFSFNKLFPIMTCNLENGRYDLFK